MEQYIPKTTLLAEIEKRKHMCDFHHGEYWDGCYDTMEDLISFLDTLKVIEVGVDLGDHQVDKSAKYIIDTLKLEVKEVDLEKEVESLIKSSIWRFAEKEDFLHVAKHFFELGLKAQKG